MRRHADRATAAPMERRAKRGVKPAVLALMAGAGALALGACASPRASVDTVVGERLNASQLERQYSNVELAWRSAEGRRGTAVFRLNGDSTVRTRQNTWRGQWWTRGTSLFCTAYPQRDANAERCVTVYRQPSGDLVAFNQDGSVHSVSYIAD